MKHPKRTAPQPRADSAGDEEPEKSRHASEEAGSAPPRTESPSTEREDGPTGEESRSCPTHSGPTSGTPKHPLSAWGIHYRTHDFHKSKLLSPQQIQSLDSIHRKFARSASASLSAFVRAKVQVQLSTVEQRSYSDFTNALPNPTSLHLAYCLPGRIPLVLEINPAILFPMMERLLGGKGDEVLLPSRALTRIEQTLAGSIARKLLHELREIWGQEPELRFDLAESEHNPLLMQIVGPSEPTLVLTFRTTLGLRMSTLHLGLPLKPFEEAISRLLRSGSPGSREGRRAEEWRERILQRLSGTHLTVSAQLPSVPLQLKDVLLLRPGDVVDTQLGRGSEVVVLVDGRKVFRGVPVIHEGRRAVKLTRCETVE